jgi:hypothetical protein
MVCETVESFADWKSVIEKLCSESKRCKYEHVEALKAVSQEIEKMREAQKQAQE